jgi:NAD+ synthase
MLPYKFTSQESLDDAAAVARALGIRYDTCRSRARSKGFEQRSPRFEGLPRDVTEENLQARARGTILMALSNKFGSMVVTTGNKSEMSVGYATLYGDMNGGFNPIKDLYKTEVYRLSAAAQRWKPDGALGPDGVVIPENIDHPPPTRGIAREPEGPGFAAALRRSRRHSRASGRARAAGRRDRGCGLRCETVVKRVERMLHLAEYKRRQAAPGVKVTLRGFGRDRRYPITNKFRDPGSRGELCANE